MDPIYVTGHRNPDTDSIVAAMAYAALRNAVGDREYKAACLGRVSDETQLVLDRFGFEPPKRITSMYTQVQDLDFDTPPVLDANVTVAQAWKTFQAQPSIPALPVANEDGTLYGMLSKDYIATYNMDLIAGAELADVPLFNVLSVLEGKVLNDAKFEDPTILVEYSKELKQTIIQGQGEHHLNILRSRIEKENKLAYEYIAPKIPYRETITKVAQADYRHKKQSGGAGQFGEVHMIIEPYYEGIGEPKNYKVPGKGDMVLNPKTKEEYDLPWGGKLQFYSAIVGGAIDARFMPAILKGIMEKMDEGPLTGSYARDIRVVIYDGKMHPVDSNEISFKLAARNAFKEAFRNAGPKIMEPIYSVEVLVPSEYMGAVMSDLQNRRAMIAGMESDKGFDRLNALVPLAELYRYSTTLSSLTSGSATYSMKFGSYEQVPADVQEKLLKAYTDTDDE